MKILSFQEGCNIIRKQLQSLRGRKKKPPSGGSIADINKRDFLNSVILESLNESEREKEQILNSLVEEVSYMDLDFNIIWMNNAGRKRLPPDLSSSQIIGKPCYEVWHNTKQPCDGCPVATTMKTGWPWKEEVTHKDGTTKLVSSQPVIDDNGKMKGVIEIELDITMRKDIELALKKSQQRSRALLDVIPDLLIVFNTIGNFLDYHPGVNLDLIEYDGNPEGKHLTEIMPPELATQIIQHSESLGTPGDSRNFEFNSQSENSEMFYDCRLIKTAVNEIVCIIRDISIQRIREKEIFYKSFHDSLTGLYNRAYFEEECNRIEQSRKTLPVSILTIDVNGLKLTNDAFGHNFGDLLLQAVSKILTSNCRKEDVIARTGGDEFVIILPNSPITKAEKLAERITAACSNFDYSGIFARPSVSIGCAVKSDNSHGLHDTIKLSDERMYHNKLENRNNHLDTLVNDILNTMKNRIISSDKHIERCTLLSAEFTKMIGFSAEAVEQIKKLALLHDIGNIRISDELLIKPGPLTEDEFTEIRKHPIIGYRIAKAIPAYSPSADLVLYHHERWDGKGYPSGLAERDIPIICRVFAVIDSWDAMTHEQIYKKTLSPDEAAAELRANSGSQFDPEIVEKFLFFIKGKV